MELTWNMWIELYGFHVVNLVQLRAGANDKSRS